MRILWSRAADRTLEPVTAALGESAARSSTAGGEMTIGRLTTSARACACLKFSPTCAGWRRFPELGVLAGASSSSARGSESSSYSTSTGRVELNNSMITQARARHRGQCLIAARYGRTAMLRPHRGQFRCSRRALASTCVLVLIWWPPSRWRALALLQALQACLPRLSSRV